MQSRITKRSIVLGGRKTSVSLEDEFWTELKAIAKRLGTDPSALIAQIDTTRGNNNLSSAVRLFVLNHARTAGK